MAKLGNNAVRDEFGLNPQEREFADTYLITLNGTESILAVKPNLQRHSARCMAWSWLKDERIINYLQYRMASKDNGLIASQDEVLQFLTAVMRNDYEAVDANRPFIPRDRIACAELLGKRYALFTEKIETSNEVVINVEIEED